MTNLMMFASSKDTGKEEDINLKSNNIIDIYEDEG